MLDIFADLDFVTIYAQHAMHDDAAAMRTLRIATASTAIAAKDCLTDISDSMEEASRLRKRELPWSLILYSALSRKGEEKQRDQDMRDYLDSLLPCQPISQTSLERFLIQNGRDGPHWDNHNINNW